MKYRFNISSLWLIILILEVCWWVPVFLIYPELSGRDDFALEHPDLAWGFIALPFLGMLIVYRWWWMNRRVTKIGDERLLQHTWKGVRPSMGLAKYGLLRFALGALLIAAINPQYGKGKLEGVSKSMDILIALDVSNSMKASDAGNNRDRLAMAKLALGKFYNGLRGDKVGLLLFAGDAKLQLPLTRDYHAADVFTEKATPNSITLQGTDIANALNESMESMEAEDGRQKAIILISDGENHEADALTIAHNAAEKGVIIHTVGVGSEKGVPVPEFDAFGRRKGNKRDAEGNTVLSRLNEDLLKEIASITGGTYVKAEGAEFGLEYLRDELAKMERTSTETIDYLDYEDQFQWFLGAGILLLALSLPLKETL